MLHIASFTFNPFQENTYILYNQNKDCWIIDPGMSNMAEEKELESYISGHALNPLAVLNTHAHIDHILGVDFLVRKFNIPFYLHKLEQVVLENAGNVSRMLGFNFPGVATPPIYITEQTVLNFGEDRIELKFVPGHSPGSIGFYYPAGNWIISGDTLFSSGIGRTDLLGGDYNTLLSSIRTELLVLPDDTNVYSGHGSATTIGSEKTVNPFLRS